MTGHTNVVEAQIRMWENDEYEDGSDDATDDPEADVDESE